MSAPLLQRFKNSLLKTRDRLNLHIISQHAAIDQATLEALEYQLLSADVGLETVDYLLENLKKNNNQAPKDAIRSALLNLFDLPHKDEPNLDIPQTILMLGVNGAGKTTTIGKLAYLFNQAQKKTLIASGDTFRAAAHEQLQVWGTRTNADVFVDKNTTDPAAVAYTALQMARARAYDYLLVDTAGRQFNHDNLMQELAKIYRSLNKQGEQWPQHIWLVIDAGSGQNGLKQAQGFASIMPINGLIITKLEGTAKGGALLSIAHQMKIPIRYVGLGEKPQDLNEFDAEAFIDSLLI